MKKLHFEQINFVDNIDKTKSIFMKYYYFYLNSKYQIEDNDLLIDPKNEKKILNDINKGINNLISLIDNKKTFYIHDKNIPLIGTNFIGITDRNTNILEVKPITGCNINCVFCSVDEGIISKKNNHFLIESDFLAEETIKLVNLKKNKIHIYINPHGEPLLYSDLPRLISKLRKNNKIETIAIITNGILLTKDKINELYNSGLTQINISLNAWTLKKAEKIAGNKYPIDKVKKMIEYASKKIKVIVSPVLVYGYNETEIEFIIKWISSLKNENIKLGIQNFLPYKRGRNPIKGIEFNKFNKILKNWEILYGLNLHDPDIGINVIKDKVLLKPYKIGEIIEFKVIAHGRYNNEFYCSNEKRNIIVRRRGLRIGQTVKSKISTNKDNIYFGI